MAERELLTRWEMALVEPTPSERDQAGEGAHAGGTDR